MKDKVGRPTVMTEATLDKLKEAFLFGCTDREACLYAGIDEKTLYNYQNANEDYSSKKAMWKDNPILLARKTVYDKMNGDGKLAMDYLRHKRSDEFNTKTNTDVTSQGEKIQTLAVEFIDAKGNENPDRV